jgi:hypothetical protein
MKLQLLISLCLFSVFTCDAEQTLAEYDWKKLADSKQLLSGSVEVVNDLTVLKIANTNSTGLQAQLLKVKEPAISGTFYAIQGEIKYENVRGDGFLEMWNYFPPIRPGMPEGQYLPKRWARRERWARSVGRRTGENFRFRSIERGPVVRQPGSN